MTGDAGSTGPDGKESATGGTASRRALLAAGGVLAAALAAGCTRLRSPGDRERGASDPLAAAVDGDVPGRWSADPDGLDAEPMGTRIREVDGTAVLYQYGRPVPAFDDWSGADEPRDFHSLDGPWRFRFDPGDRGIAEGWYAADVDESAWRSVQVPLPWDLHDTPGFGSYDGSNYGRGTAFQNGFAWYRRRFRVGRSWDGRLVRLNFLGASYAAWVFVNGRFVGQHEGGHTPFSLDVSDALRPGGENVVAVRVFRRPWWQEAAGFSLPVVNATEVPGRPVDYWPYAGLTRSVYLEATPPLTVTKLLADAGDGVLRARAVVENRGDRPVRRRLHLDPGAGTGGEPRSIDVEAYPGEVRVPAVQFDVPYASSWSFESPTRYELTARFEDDEGPGDVLSTRYGVRSLSTEEGRLTLNGDPVFLKGVNWHEEAPERGRSLGTEGYDDLLDRLDDLDANFLRNSHYNRHPYLYEAADRAGVLVMDEADNMWLDGRQQRIQAEGYGLSRALVAATVWNQHNHPSVGLWSLHNECDHHAPAYRGWLADLRAAATTLDRQERPVTWGARSPADPEFDLADVVGFNEYYGYFRGSDDDLGRRLDALHEAFPEKPLLVTENGTWSAPELRGRPENSLEEPGTPEWQAAKFERHWEQVADEARLPFVAGYTYWTLRDYKERNGYNQDNYNGISTMGLLSFAGEHETLAYGAFRDVDNPRRGRQAFDP